MARTHSTFDETYPAGTLAANQIDEIVRRTRLEVKELLEQGVVEDCDEDPVVLKDAVSGRKLSKKLVIPAHAFNGADSSTPVHAYRTQDEEANGYWAAIVLPPGVTIRLIEVLFNNGTAGQVDISVKKIAFSVAATETTVWEESDSVGGLHIADSGAIAEVVSEDAYYVIEIDAPGSSELLAFLLYAVRITYDTESHLTTI